MISKEKMEEAVRAVRAVLGDVGCVVFADEHGDGSIIVDGTTVGGIEEAMDMLRETMSRNLELLETSPPSKFDLEYNKKMTELTQRVHQMPDDVPGKEEIVLLLSDADAIGEACVRMVSDIARVVDEFFADFVNVGLEEITANPSMIAGIGMQYSDRMNAICRIAEAKLEISRLLPNGMTVIDYVRRANTVPSGVTDKELPV